MVSALSGKYYLSHHSSPPPASHSVCTDISQTAFSCYLQPPPPLDLLSFQLSFQQPHLDVTSYRCKSLRDPVSTTSSCSPPCWSPSLTQKLDVGQAPLRFELWVTSPELKAWFCCLLIVQTEAVCLTSSNFSFHIYKMKEILYYLKGWGSNVMVQGYWLIGALVKIRY